MDLLRLCSQGDKKALASIVDDVSAREAALDALTDATEFNAKERRRLKRLLTLVSNDVNSNQGELSGTAGPSKETPGPRSFSATLAGLEAATDLASLQTHLDALAIPASPLDESEYAIEFRAGVAALQAVLRRQSVAAYTNKLLRRRMTRFLFALNPQSSATSSKGVKRDRPLDEPSQSIPSHFAVALKDDGKGARDAALQLVSARDAQSVEVSIDVLAKADTSNLCLEQAVYDELREKIESLLLDDSTVTVISSAIRRKLRRLLGRLDSAALEPSPASSTPVLKKPSSKKSMRPYFTAFVGQLAFESSAESLKQFLQTSCSPDEPIKVRLLTNKGDGSSRGMAFVETESIADVRMLSFALGPLNDCTSAREVSASSQLCL